jgi:hypothetical protein
MDFRRSGQLDERRRRVLMDEIASPADDGATSAPSASAASGPVRAYSAVVLTERQPRITDLLPVRLLLVAFLLLLGFSGVAAIEAIHIHTASLRVGDRAAALAALDVAEPGGLSAWYSSAVLAWAAALSLVVFSIRAHRVDDYGGRYRIWLWTCGALIWLSLDVASGMHRALGLGLVLAGGKQVFTGALSPASTLAWLTVYGLLFGALAIRIGMEVWCSLSSFSSLVISTLLYLVSALIRLQMLVPESAAMAPVIDSAVTMLAHVFLANTVLLYARHVYLDAQGRLKVHIDPDKRKLKPKARPKLTVVKSDKNADNKDKDVSKPAAAPLPAAATSKPSDGLRFGSNTAATSSASISKSSLNQADYDDDEDDDSYGGKELSKSERRRLKKLARREQQRRAA